MGTLYLRFLLLFLRREGTSLCPLKKPKRYGLGFFNQQQLSFELEIVEFVDHF